MPLSIDQSCALRTNSELVQLAEAVLDASTSEPESDSVEWKSDWNLGNAATRFETARHLLGFGNRDPLVAGNNFEGCAYLLAGVEPQCLVGTEVFDPAALDDQLSRYIAPGQPRWSPNYVTVRGITVLILTVEAPRAGDPICALQKGFDKTQAGRIFVRRHGKTEEASPADIRILENRLKTQRPKVSLEVAAVNPDQSLRRICLSESRRDEWLEKERSRLSLPARREPSLYRPLTPAFLEDMRDKSEFKNEVAEYLENAETRWLGEQLEAGIEEELAPVALQIINPTEQNFEGVEVLIEFPAGPYAWLDKTEVFDVVGAPTPPKSWGDEKLSISVNPPVAARGLSLDVVERSESNLVKFHETHIRPGETKPLPPIHLTLPEGWSDEQLSLRWRLTSTAVDGWQEGEISYEVQPH